MFFRFENTIAGVTSVSGHGFFSGADATVRFLPAPPGYGIRFQRIDLQGTDPIPATISYTCTRQRRTAIEFAGAAVELTEHVLAALAGLRIDNCLVEIDAIEPPGLDGSCLGYVEALLAVGVAPQSHPRRALVIEHPVRVQNADGSIWAEAAPAADGFLSIATTVDYGADSPIPRQFFDATIRPPTFIRDIAPARTFVLESEVAMLRAAGYGMRTTAKDLLVFGPQGPIDNTLRSPNECARHKVLDCVGDLALLGCDLVGRIEAHRSGHQLNAELARAILKAHSSQSSHRRAA